ncbi:hypothetical protein C8R46DRAFT_274460 [Mycena filopes]|nr:hypothetical protein C8R46DRAFT_274460 [Mycena filopes]
MRVGTPVFVTRRNDSDRGTLRSCHLRADQKKPQKSLPGIPDFREGIEEWNAAFEAAFPSLDLAVGNLEELVTTTRLASGLASEELARDCTTASYLILRGLRRIQAEMHVLAVTSVLQPNFYWKQLTPAARKAHLLEGMMRTCLDDPVGCPTYRMFTSDVTLASLEANSGEGFLALLRRYLPDGEVNATGSGCISFWHPHWKKEVVEPLRIAGHAPQLQLYMAQRDQFLTWFLYSTVLSTIGTPRPAEIAVKSPGKGFDTTLDWGSIPKRATKKTLNSGEPVYRLAHSCDGCSQPEADGVHFEVCKKCNEKAGRKVFYCSRQCQISHWPNHKKICGKELTPTTAQNHSLHTDESLAEAVFLLRRIDPARDGYTRSPALLRQIMYLDATPGRDYVFFSPNGPRPASTIDFVVRLVYRLTIQTAMTTGDAKCIMALAEMTFPMFPEAFVEQFVAEYGDPGRFAANFVRANAGRSPFSGETVGRWSGEFLKTASGSRYAKIPKTTTVWPEPVETPADVRREAIVALREWWPRRS